MAGWQVRATLSPLRLLCQVAWQLLGRGQGAGTAAPGRDGGGLGDLFTEKMLSGVGGRMGQGLGYFYLRNFQRQGWGGVCGGGRGRDLAGE